MFQVPILALTATATAGVTKEVMATLGLKACFRASPGRPNLRYEVQPRTRATLNALVERINANPGQCGIIYCLSRRGVEKVPTAICASHAVLPALL